MPSTVIPEAEEAAHVPVPLGKHFGDFFFFSFFCRLRIRATTSHKKNKKNDQTKH